MQPKVRQHFLNFKPISYLKDDEEIRNNQDIIDCSHGINPYGCSPLIAEDELMLKLKVDEYPPSPFKSLKESIVNYWSDTIKLETNNLRITTASIGALESITKLFIDKDSKVLGYSPQFSDYISYIHMYGGEYESIRLRKEENYKFNYQDVINKINGDYRLIYIDNPNNPTGQAIPVSQLEKIIKTAENNDVCVIIDEAYGDFMDKENSALTLINKYDNLFVAKSFSKGYGLPGLRIGFMACSKPLLTYYDMVHQPFDNNVAGIHAAILSLKDETFIQQSIDRIKESKMKLIDSLSMLNVFETSLDVPILTIQHPDEEIDLYKELLKNNILAVSDIIGLGKNAVRIRIPENVEGLIQAFQHVENETKGTP